MDNFKTKFKQTEIELIPEEWGVVRAGDIFNIFTGKKDVNQTIPDGEYVFFSCSPDEYRSSEYIFDGSAIIVVGNGSYTGTVRFYSGKFDLYQRTYAVVLKEDQLAKWDIKFLYFYFKIFFEREFMGGSRGSSIPYIVRGNIEEFFLPTLPLPEQSRIASILSSLDDKIELNRKMNANLEQIASALFKRWFVDFEFPNADGKPYKSSGGRMIESELGEIPEGWKVDSLDRIADFLNGLALQRYPAESKENYLPVIKIRELNNGITADSDKASANIPKEYIVKNGDVVFSWSGSLDAIIWCNGKGALNQHLFKVTSHKYPKWFYYYWIKYFLPSFQNIAADKAVTMGHIKRGHLTESKVTIPNDSTLLEMNKLMSPLVELLINNSIEIQRMMMLRDSLLPRLMSGRIRVK